MQQSKFNICFYFLLVAILPVTAFSQRYEREFKAAETAYNNGNYPNAIKLYEASWDHRSNGSTSTVDYSDLLCRIAECSRKLGDYAQEVQWYRKAIKSGCIDSVEGKKYILAAEQSLNSDNLKAQTSTPLEIFSKRFQADSLGLGNSRKNYVTTNKNIVLIDSIDFTRYTKNKLIAILGKPNYISEVICTSCKEGKKRILYRYITQQLFDKDHNLMEEFMIDIQILNGKVVEVEETVLSM